jgi:hypothetical protein
MSRFPIRETRRTPAVTTNDARLRAGADYIVLTNLLGCRRRGAELISWRIGSAYLLHSAVDKEKPILGLKENSCAQSTNLFRAYSDISDCRQQFQ